MLRKRYLGMMSFCALAQSALPQSPSISGSIQLLGVSGRFNGDYKTTDRFARTQLIAEQGAWTATASIWNYAFCQWHDLDETNLAYRFGNSRIRVGRFLNPVGMSTWDDQWYSSFVFVPLLELNAYSGRKVFERTLTGVEVDTTSGPDSFKFSATSARFQQDQLLPDKLDRLSLRWSHYHAGTVIGAAVLADTDSWGGQEQIVAFDVRHTIPHWIFRGQLVGSATQALRSNGFFAEASYRAAGWEDLTLGLRHEGILGMLGSSNWIFATTASAKVELPFSFTFQANYTFGPDMNRQPLGGGLSFGLAKTIKF